jgi:hypothetical protein
VERSSATHPRIVELLGAALLNMLLRVPGQLACLLLEVSAKCDLNAICCLSARTHDCFGGDVPSCAIWWSQAQRHAVVI